MQHLSAAIVGRLEPAVVRRDLATWRELLDRLESLSLLISTAERARRLRGECAALLERLAELARAGYAPLCSLPPGSYIAPEFHQLGLEVSEQMRRTRRIMDYCLQIETLALLREQAEAEREHRRRFPVELDLLEAHREVLAALYPDRWLLLYDGAIRGEFDTAQEALQAGEQMRGRDDEGRPRFLVFCHRSPARQAAPPR
ncbi:MAG: hypothetical protein RMK29_09770 [Myxococcales bacterium]|nr:hypothetical protein [Myxococcota bacterium]MDW8281989.1 hypothetical protein [Myxococcales bacterium]